MIKCQTPNSSPPSDADMRQWIGSPLVQIMTCRLFGATPLSKPMLDYCQTLWIHFSESLIKTQNFSFTKMLLKISSAKWRPYLSRGRWVKLCIHNCWAKANITTPVSDCLSSILPHITPASSAWAQSWTPQPLWSQWSIDDSLPIHSTESSNMGSVPSPNSAMVAAWPPIMPSCLHTTCASGSSHLHERCA